MKTTRFKILAAIVLCALGGEAQAQTNYYWDANGNTAGTGGTGTWTTANTWRVNSPTGSLVTWANGNNAIFQGNAGVVTVGTTAVTPTTAFFQVNGYTLQTDASPTTRSVNGNISITAGMNLNLMDSTATATRSLNIGGNITGGAGITIQGNQASGASSRINLSVASTTISTPITINETGAGVAGIVAQSTGTSISGTITNNSTGLTMIGATPGSDITLTSTAIISGSSGLQFSAGVSSGMGLVTLNSQSTYTGITNFNADNAGIVRLGVNNALPTGTDVIMGATSGNGGILDLHGFNQTIGSLTSGAGGGSITNQLAATASVLTISGSSSPAAFSLPIADGAGTVSLTRSGTGATILAGTNNYTGTTTISGGTLQFAQQASLYNGNTGNWTAANIIVNSGGTLALNVGGSNEFATGNVTTVLTNLGGLGGAVSGNGFQAGSRIAFDTTNAAGGTFTVADNIADSTGTGGGAIGVTKLGTSTTLTLNGTNTYTGPTSINAGTLALGSTGSLNHSATITVGASGTYDVSAVSGGYTLGSSATQTLGGTGTVLGSVTVAPGSVIRGDSTGGTGALTIGSGTNAASVNLGGGAANAILRVEASPTNASLIYLANTSGVLNLNPGAGNKFTIDLVSNTANPLVANTPYTITLATVATAGNIQLNGSSLGANSSIAASNYTLQSSDFSFTNVSLGIDSNGVNLLLTFTPVPVPEPSAVLGIAVAALSVGAFVRRRLRKPTEHTTAA